MLILVENMDKHNQCPMEGNKNENNWKKKKPIIVRNNIHYMSLRCNQIKVMIIMINIKAYNTTQLYSYLKGYDISLYLIPKQPCAYHK